MTSPDVWAFGQAGYNGGPYLDEAGAPSVRCYPVDVIPASGTDTLKRYCHPKRTRPGACEENRELSNTYPPPRRAFEVWKTPMKNSKSNPRFLGLCMVRAASA